VNESAARAGDCVARRSLLAVAIALISACASVPPTSPVVVPAADPREAFAIEGRLSARSPTEAVTVQFAWSHDPPRDDVTIATPLGQTVAILSGDGATSKVEVRLPDGRRDEAGDWTTLTGRALGFPLPVDGLSAWVRGAPRHGAPHSAEPDRFGRLAVLRQDGWEIVYAYPDDAARRPNRLRLTYPEVEVRVVVDAWR
jgi:outer membrane lipoprotein LolB